MSLRSNSLGPSTPSPDAGRGSDPIGYSISAPFFQHPFKTIFHRKGNIAGVHQEITNIALAGIDLTTLGHCVRKDVLYRGLRWNDLPNERTDSINYVGQCPTSSTNLFNFIRVYVTHFFSPSDDPDSRLKQTHAWKSTFGNEQYWHAMTIEKERLTREHPQFKNFEQKMQEKIWEWFSLSVANPKNLRIDYLGRILHLVQDSYAEGHTYREKKDEVREYYNFLHQEGSNQHASDKSSEIHSWSDHTHRDSWDYVFQRDEDGKYFHVTTKWAIDSTAQILKDWVQTVQDIRDMSKSHSPKESIETKGKEFLGSLMLCVFGRKIKSRK